MKTLSRCFAPVVVVLLTIGAAQSASAQPLDRFGVVSPIPSIDPLQVQPAAHCPLGQHLNEAGTACVPNGPPALPAPESLPSPGAELQIRKQGTAHATEAVKVRSGPGAAYPKLWTLEPDIMVSVGECGSGWCHIGAPQGNGWVAARYLTFGG